MSEEVSFPPLWEKYPRLGSYITDIQAVPFKLPFPLSAVKSKGLPLAATWTIDMAKSAIKNRGYDLRCIINVSEQNFPYTDKELISHGIQLINIPSPMKTIPTGEVYSAFEAALSKVLDSFTEDDVVGICCEDGFNKIGYLISRYLYEAGHNDIVYSVNRFISSNEPGIFKGSFLDAVYNDCNEADHPDRLDPIKPYFLSDREFSFFNRTRAIIGRVERQPDINPLDIMTSTNSLPTPPIQSSSSQQTLLLDVVQSSQDASSGTLRPETSSLATNPPSPKRRKTPHQAWEENQHGKISPDRSLLEEMGIHSSLFHPILSESSTMKSIEKEIIHLLSTAHDSSRRKKNPNMKSLEAILTEKGLRDILDNLLQNILGSSTALPVSAATKDESAQKDGLKNALRHAAAAAALTLPKFLNTPFSDISLEALRCEWRKCAPLITWCTGRDVLVLLLSSGTYVFDEKGALYCLPQTKFYHRKQEGKLLTASMLAGSLIVENGSEGKSVPRLLLHDVFYFNGNFLRDVTSSIRTTMVNVEFVAPWQAKQSTLAQGDIYLRVRQKPSFYALNEQIEKLSATLTAVPHQPTGLIFLPRCVAMSYYDGEPKENVDRMLPVRVKCGKMDRVSLISNVKYLGSIVQSLESKN